MQAMVRISIILLLVMISTELVAPLLAKAHSNNHEIKGALSRAEKYDFADIDADESSCLDQCGLPTHTHMSQFPPSAFHECFKNPPVSTYDVRVFNGPVSAHIVRLIRPPILV